MSKPITLWQPRRSVTSDESCTTVVKYSYKNTAAVPAPYEATSPHGPLVYIPSLQSLCIRILSQYPDQLHVLGSTRLLYEPPDAEGDHDLLRELIPASRSDPPTPEADILRTVDPRIWATLVQIYDGLPELFRTYKLPLADAHLPLLQSIPSSDHFALVTVLELRACRELTDDTIVHLGQLRALTALDASATSLTAWGVRTFTKTLMRGAELASHPSALSGPWGLRILSLRDCFHINKDVLPSLELFPLLSVVDFKGTAFTHVCDENDVFGHGGDPSLYHPASPFEVLRALDEISHACRSISIYPHAHPFYLHIDALEHKRVSRTKHPSMLKPKSKLGFDRLPQLERSSSVPSQPRHGEEERIAADEARRHASRAAASTFYSSKSTASSAPLTFGKFGEIFNLPTPISSARRAKSTAVRRDNPRSGQDPQRLYREPPPWSALEAIRRGSSEETSSGSAAGRPTQRMGSDERPLSSPSLVTSQKARESVGAVFDMLKSRLGASATQTAKGKQLETRKSVENPFSRKMFEDAFNLGPSRTEEPGRADDAPRKRRRVSMQTDSPQDEIEPEVPKSTLPIPPRSTKPTRPISTLPIPILPPGLRIAGEGASRPKPRLSCGTPVRPAVEAVQTRLNTYLGEDAASGRASGAGFRPGVRGSATAVACVEIGEPSGSQVQGSSSSAARKKRKSADSAPSFDWKRWGT